MNARFAVLQFMLPFIRPYWRRLAYAMFGLALARAFYWALRNLAILLGPLVPLGINSIRMLMPVDHHAYQLRYVAMNHFTSDPSRRQKLKYKRS
jgi:hypothetical protein